MNRAKPGDAGERRHHQRRDCRADIQWSYFNREQRYQGTMHNYSSSGAYIEATRRLTPGATILLHTGKIIIACEKTDGCLSPNATIFAEIKWQHAAREDHDRRRYGAGIRFHL